MMVMQRSIFLVHPHSRMFWPRFQVGRPQLLRNKIIFRNSGKLINTFRMEMVLILDDRKKEKKREGVHRRRPSGTHSMEILLGFNSGHSWVAGSQAGWIRALMLPVTQVLRCHVWQYCLCLIWAERTLVSESPILI